MSALSYLDYLFIIIFILSTVWGLARGLVRSLLGFFLWLVALGLSFYLGQHYFYWFVRFTPNVNLQLILAYIIFFIIIVFIEWLLKFFLHLLLPDDSISALDRLAGGIFGLLRGFLFGMLIAFGLNWAHRNEGFTIPRSILLPNFMTANHWVETLIEHPPVVAKST